MFRLLSNSLRIRAHSLWGMYIQRKEYATYVVEEPQ